jgi:hypothetical protein
MLRLPVRNIQEEINSICKQGVYEFLEGDKEFCLGVDLAGNFHFLFELSNTSAEMR